MQKKPTWHRYITMHGKYGDGSEPVGSDTKPTAYTASRLIEAVGQCARRPGGASTRPPLSKLNS